MGEGGGPKYEVLIIEQSTFDMLFQTVVKMYLFPAKTGHGCTHPRWRRAYFEHRSSPCQGQEPSHCLLAWRSKLPCPLISSAQVFWYHWLWSKSLSEHLNCLLHGEQLTAVRLLWSDLSWLPYSTYLYLDFHLCVCLCVSFVFHDKAKRTQQGNLLVRPWPVGHSCAIPASPMHYGIRAVGAMSLRITELCLLFSPHSYISDGYFNLDQHFFQLYSS